MGLGVFYVAHLWDTHTRKKKKKRWRKIDPVDSNIVLNFEGWAKPVGSLSRYRLKRLSRFFKMQARHKTTYCV